LVCRNGRATHAIDLEFDIRAIDFLSNGTIWERSFLTQHVKHQVFAALGERPKEDIPPLTHFAMQSPHYVPSRATLKFHYNSAGHANFSVDRLGEGS
jgi:hypothetical protein